MRKTLQPAQKAQKPLERPEIWKRGLFHSPAFRITCIIRNNIKIKNRGPLLLRSVIGAGFGSLCCSLYHFVWDAWIACQAGIAKYSWIRPLSCERPLHQTLQRRIQRLCSEVRADSFIVNARHCLTAFFAAKLCNVLFAGHKALFCQNRRTVYIFQQGKASLVPYFGMGALYKLLYLALIINVPDAAVAAELCACGLHSCASCCAK